MNRNLFAGRWVLPALVVGFILVAVAEVWLLTFVGSRIGALPTLGILLAEALVGAWLLRREGSKAWTALTQAINTGRMPTGQLADAALVLIGGIMLMLPGFFTDFIGVFFLLPLTRPLVRKSLGFLIARQAAKSGVDFGVIKAKYGPGTVIRGETADDVPSPATDAGTSVVIEGEIEPGGRPA
ncbi:MAG TPA: FxsA family protein [Propionicimonas sp.]|nr:FxsA family protein [Propionicimonas sp.]HQA78778.1 FxsA family protein [Propionicimonas sp.]HQD97377.1 FxsA family protein [Propionicimonas sp.]